jgi:hypothetical protein
VYCRRRFHGLPATLAHHEEACPARTVVKQLWTEAYLRAQTHEHRHLHPASAPSREGLTDVDARAREAGWTGGRLTTRGRR